MHEPEQPKQPRSWYEIFKDFLSPIILAVLASLLAFVFANKLGQQQQVSSEIQSKEMVLRDMMTKSNGPDVAFFTAVGERLTVHLQRYKELRQKIEQGNATEEMERAADFDQKAIYFFYGMYRVAVVDFLATKGFVLYPRIWMEEAFEGLNHGIVEEFMGTQERINLHPEEEAALYRYFGAMKATYHTGSKRADESSPDLFEFTLILTNTPSSPTPSDTPSNQYYHDSMVNELKKGFSRFQTQLQNNKIDFERIILAVEAMIGLDDYAFNTLFPQWYQQFKISPPVELHEFLSDPPEDFLRYPLPTFDETAGRTWCTERQNVWCIILENVPPALREKGGQKKNPCP